LLEVLIELGGCSPARDTYPLMTRKFLQLNQSDLEEKVSNGDSKWINKIQWARATLKEKCYLVFGGPGIWVITKKGHDYISSLK
jgi:hypothetical protein